MPVQLTKTKHYRLAEELWQEIKEMPPGTPVPTVEELKQRFGASQVTIDKAILQLKHKGLIRRPDGRKRMVVADLRDRPAQRVAIIRPDFPSLIFEEIARAVVAAGRQKDWAFDLIHYREIESFDLAGAMDSADAAVLMINPKPLSKQLLVELRHPRKPVVVTQDLLNDEPEIPAVCTDDQRVTELLAQHLIAQGHRQIALVVPCLTSGPMLAAAEGWRASLRAAGVADIEPLLINTQVPPFEHSLRWIYKYMTRWFEESPRNCTAFIGATTESTMAVMRMLREHGLRIPDDISVVGSCGFYEFGGFLDPPVTSVEYDLNRYGREIVELLSAEKRPDAANLKVKIQPILQIGRSSRPINPEVRP